VDGGDLCRFSRGFPSPWPPNAFTGFHQGLHGAGLLVGWRVTFFTPGSGRGPVAGPEGPGRGAQRSATCGGQGASPVFGPCISTSLPDFGGAGGAGATPGGCRGLVSPPRPPWAAAHRTPGVGRVAVQGLEHFGVVAGVLTGGYARGPGCSGTFVGIGHALGTPGGTAAATDRPDRTHVGGGALSPRLHVRFVPARNSRRRAASGSPPRFWYSTPIKSDPRSGVNARCSRSCMPKAGG